LQCKQRSHGVDFESKLTRMPDERETVHVRNTAAAAIAFGPGRRAPKPDLFVVPDRRNFHARLSSGNGQIRSISLSAIMIAMGALLVGGGRFVDAQ